ncbi:MAG TPA: alpha/beta hydrolase [Thermomicrobiales bacterium]|nr:alpha/beta hydrolase [Thermomicrobiales bacterium]
MTIAPTLSSITLPTGVTLPYVEQGDPAGTPVVLLHGITDSWRSFEPVLPYLPPSVRVFALTQRGHGEADRPATGYSPRDFAADLTAFIDALHLGAVVVAGHSMGSAVAQRFAADEADRTRGLVLIGGAAAWSNVTDIRELWDEVISTMTEPVDPDFVREFQASTVTRPMSPELLETVVSESLKLPARTWRAVFREALIEADTAAGLGNITAPTLIVWGDQDAMTGAYQNDLVAAIPGARHVTYPDAGHGTHWDAPERFAADLTAFVEGITR